LSITVQLDNLVIAKKKKTFKKNKKNKNGVVCISSFFKIKLIKKTNI